MTQRSIGRRAFLAVSAGSLLRAGTGKGTSFTDAPQHFLDRATELDIYRLTHPDFTTRFPAPDLHFVSRRGRFLLICSDRGGTMQVWRLDWHSGEMRQITSAAALDPDAVALTVDDRSAIYFDGRALKQITLSGLRERELATVREGWERAPGFSVNADGASVVWVEHAGARWELRCLQAQGAPFTLSTADVPIESPCIRPRNSQVFFKSGGAAKIMDLPSRQSRDAALNAGAAVIEPLWSPRGDTVLYLSVPTGPTQLTTLREYAPEEKTDKLVAKTSQFACFGINGDGSVFAGASRSAASPYLLLLLRVSRRELTLCEHRCSDPRVVTPVFSADSQNVFFVSDRQGKPAIYRSHVERFVEETDSEA